MLNKSIFNTLLTLVIICFIYSQEINAQYSSGYIPLPILKPNFNQTQSIESAEYLFNQGFLLYQENNYQEALQFFYEALSNFQLINDEISSAATLTFIARSYQSLKQYDESLGAYQKALNLIEKHVDVNPELSSTIFSELGILYQNLGQNELAKLLLERASIFSKNTIENKQLDFSENHGNNIGVVKQDEEKKALTMLLEKISEPGFSTLLLGWTVLVLVLVWSFPLLSGFIFWIRFKFYLNKSAIKQKNMSEKIRLYSDYSVTELPKLKEEQELSTELIKDSKQDLYLFFVLLPTILLILTLIGVAFVDISIAIIVLVYLGLLTLLFWISWQLLFSFVKGNAIEITEFQYPQLYRLIDEASKILAIETPMSFVMQGNGLYETLVIKMFNRRGMIIITSNLLDDLTSRGASRQLMFFLGRQLGLMATGYFRFWFTKGILGKIALPFYLAWERRCQYTADRIGLLVAGDLRASEQAMITITAGSAVEPSTNIAALFNQRQELLLSYWAWVRFMASSYPYMIDRILRLRDFASFAVKKGINAQHPIGALPLGHNPIRSLPILIIHGHDSLARLELENFFLKRFPYVVPVSMTLETVGANTLPEKFEKLASGVQGAVALLTPDDLATTIRTGEVTHRARQNVMIEIGWLWGRLGRNHCLLLMRDLVEIPSDLSGIDVHSYKQSPSERFEAVRDFIEKISHR